MDEPEISLHFEWQKQLIGLVLKLNPNIQIIMAPPDSGVRPCCSSFPTR